jgi:hypothetical protein
MSLHPSVKALLEGREGREGREMRERRERRERRKMREVSRAGHRRCHPSKVE